MLQVIKEQLLRICEDIDASNTHLSEEDGIKIIKYLKKFNSRGREFNKYQAYTYLGISRAKFDKYVREGKIPRGRKVEGSRELRWNVSDIKNLKL